MIVSPDLLLHPKFRRLERRLRREALYVLFRIWAHCQLSTRGEFWQGADEEYVEIVADWQGEPGKCAAALLELGWISRITDGIVVKGWNEQNAALRSAWSNGSKGGRASHSPARGEKTHGLPTGNPRVTHRLPTGNPSVTHGTSDRIGEERMGGESPCSPPGGTSAGGAPQLSTPPVQIPENLAREWLREMIGAGAKFTEEDFLEAWRLLHATRDGETGTWRVGRAGRVSDPRVILEQRLHDAMGRRLSRSSPTRTTNSSAMALRQRIDALTEEIKAHKGNPDGVWPEHVRDANHRAWMEKRKTRDELNRKLAQLNGEPGHDAAEPHS